MTAHQAALREVQGDAMEIVALADHRARELVAPVLAQVLELRDYGVPKHKIDAMLRTLRECCAFNGRIAAKAHEVCGRLERLAASPEPGPLTVRGIVQALRPPLRVLADPAAFDARDYVAACAELRDISAGAGRDKVLCESVRKNLGGRMHALLVALLEGDGAEFVDYVLEHTAPVLEAVAA